MPCDKEIAHLKAALECKKNIIYKLEDKLYTYDDELNKKEDMQTELYKLEQWLENIQCKSIQMENDMLNDLNVQTEKLNDIEACKCALKKKNNELHDENDCTNQQLNETKKEEQKLLNEIDDLNNCKNRIQNDVCNLKAEVKESKCMINKWSKTLQCREKEYCGIRSKVEDCKITCNRLNDACAELTADVECIAKEISAAKSRLKLTAQKLKYEEETLSNELNIKYQQLHVVETEHCEAQCTIDDEKAKIENLHTSAVELRDACECNSREMTCKIHNLKEENSAKAESLCCVKNRIKEQSEENESLTLEIDSLKKQLIAIECLIEKMKRSAEVLEQQKNNKCEQMEKDIHSLRCDIHVIETKIADADREIKVLQENSKKPIDVDKCPSTATDDNSGMKIAEKLNEIFENNKFISELKQLSCSEEKSKQCEKTV